MADLPAQRHSRFTLFLARTLLLIRDRYSRPLSLACDTRSSLAGPHTLISSRSWCSMYGVLRKLSRGTAKVHELAVLGSLPAASSAAAKIRRGRGRLSQKLF
jgi:hypothetical protein